MSMLEFQPKIILTPNDTLMLSMLGKFRTLYTRGISLHDLTIGGPSKNFFLSLACDYARRCFALGLFCRACFT